MSNESVVCEYSSRTSMFKLAMRRIAGTVCVVTTGTGSSRTGFTATSVTSLSISPPTVLFCVNSSSSSAASIRKNGAFCVNVLNSDQADVARRFTGLGGEVGEQRYAGARWEELGTGSSALLGAAVSLDCYVDEIVSKNTHSIVIGSVAEIVTADVLPLLYFEGEYSPMINRKIGKLL